MAYFAHWIFSVFEKKKESLLFSYRKSLTSVDGNVNGYFLQLYYLLAVLSADPMIQATIKDAYLGYD